MKENPRPYNLNYRYGSDLREIPEDARSMQAYVEFLIQQYKGLGKDQVRVAVKFLGEAGSYARILGKADLAYQCLDRSLNLIDEHKLELAIWAVHSIRFGEVLRLKKDDLGAETAFQSVLEMSRRHPEIADLEDFALQHLGKLKLQQREWKKAEEYLHRALKLRQQKGVSELIDSTEIALDFLSKQTRQK